MNITEESFKDKILDLSFSGIYVYDLLKGSNIYINKQYTRLTGYTSEDIDYMSQQEFFELFHPLDQEAIKNHMEEVINSSPGEIIEIEYRFKKADGSWMWCSSKDAIFDVDEKKQTTQFIGSFIDITKQKEQERKVNHSNQLLTMAVGTVSMVIWETHVENGEIVWEGDASKLYNCSIRDLETFDKWSKFLYAEDLKLVAEKMDLASKTKKIQTLVFRITDAKGQLKYIEASIMAVFNDAGEVIKHIGTNKDITQEKENDLILLRAKEELEQLNKTIVEERERLQYYFDSMPSVIVLIDVKGKVKMVNKSACDLYGYTKEEMIGQDFLQNYIPKRLIKETIIMFQNLMAGDMDNAKYIENWALRKDGSERLMAWKSSNIYDEEGNIIGGISSGDDITKKARNEERTLLLKEFAEAANESRNLEEVLFKALKSICDFTNWPVGHVYFPDSDNDQKLIPSKIWYVEGDREFKTLKEATARTEFSFGEGLPGIAWKEQKVIWADEFRMNKNFLREGEARSQGLKGAFSLPIISRGDVVVVFEFFYEKSQKERIDMLDEFVGELQEQLDALIDREKFQEELKEARLQAEQANKAKSAFLANMSHEIRTPMNAILGHAQILKRASEVTPEQKKSIDIINKSGKHLLGLINEVLNMSKIEMGKMELTTSSFSLLNLLKELIQMFQFDIKKKGLSLTLENSPDLPELIQADQNKVRQILINLLANSVKFTNQGSILIKSSLKDGVISVSVLDTGIGIPKDELDGIFGAFVQADGGMMKGGTGLGLSISKRMAQLMGGDIVVKSKPNKGSEFSFNFPYAKSGEKINNPNALKEVVGLKKGQSKVKILVVDDVVENQDVLKVLLESTGFKVKIAKDGKEGVDLFKKWKPDTILMDMVMPVMDGIEATREIRKMKEGKEVGIIAISASAFDEERKEILLSGANEFIRKPYTENELFDKIKKCTGVKYVYNESNNYENNPQASNAEVLHYDLSNVQKKEFLKAIKEGDIDEIENLAEKIKSKNQALYQHIRGQLEAMELETLEELF